GHRHRLRPQRELAIWVAVTTVEHPPPLRPPLHQLTRAALCRAGDAEAHWFGHLTGGVGRTGQELTVAAFAADHRRAALLTDFAGQHADLIGARVLGFERPCRLALRVAGAGQEFPVASEPDDHRLPTLLADLAGGFNHILDAGHVL